MWTKGSRSVRSAPANARRTGNPSPSRPCGASTTSRTGRCRAVSGTPGTRSSFVMSGVVMAGMVFLSSRWATLRAHGAIPWAWPGSAYCPTHGWGLELRRGEIGHRVAIDIGGTFTDLAAVDVWTGELVVTKAPSTPARLDDGVMAALDRSGVPASSVDSLVHGTTVVINAITERRGVPTALVTTRGFRDVLEIGRANRPDLYNLSYEKPVPFVPRRYRFEVAERMSYRGDVITALDEEELRSVARTIEGSGIEAAAVCFLHAWANPAHERRAAELLGELLPGIEIVASHEVSGQWREYERTSTAVLSAYVKPVVARYLAALANRVREAGMAGPLYAVRSGGGVASFERAASAPIHLLESG